MILFLKIKYSITIVSIIFIISSLKVNIYYKKNQRYCHYYILKVGS